MRLACRTGVDDRDLDASRLVALRLHQAGRGLEAGQGRWWEFAVGLAKVSSSGACLGSTPVR